MRRFDRFGMRRTTPFKILTFIVGASCVSVSFAIYPWLSYHLPVITSYISKALRPSAAGEEALQVDVLPSTEALIIAPPGAEINLHTDFFAQSPLLRDHPLDLYLVDAGGADVARVENDLNNDRTILPTSRWVGPISILSTLTIPKLRDGTYSVRVSLGRNGNAVHLAAGSGVKQDAQLRYTVGFLKIDASAPQPAFLSPPELDLRGYRLTFDEPFTQLSISDAAQNDGARWYAKNEECCMSTSDGAATAMARIASPQNPYSLIPGGGLNIRLQRIGNSWTSGVLTSVDSSGRGFSQQYGYFEMKAKFPKGEDTWPAFWMLNTASKRSGAPAGEIDIVEYVANPGFKNYITTTLHDWSDKTAPAASHHRVQLPSEGFHTYGMMWTETTITFYFDGSVTLRCPTPAIMKQPYYLLVDLGIGSGWPTEKTPFRNDMQVQYIRAYSKAN